MSAVSIHERYTNKTTTTSCNVGLDMLRLGSMMLDLHFAVVYDDMYKN